MLARASGRINRISAIEHTTPAIERSRAPVNNVAASPNLEIGLGFVLQFLGFLGATRVPLNFINGLLNIELHTRDFIKELMALQGSVF